MTSLPRSVTASAANRLLEELKIRQPEEIDIELIAAHQGLSILFKPLRKEEGHLIHAGSVGIIVVAEAARGSGKWRFVVAHEIGHFVRHPKFDQLRYCTDADLHNWRRSGGHEVEANDFAAELLMPQSLFEKLCDCNRPSLREVDKLSALFQTSLTATAVRFVQFCPEPCAVVYSVNGIVEWASPTRSFPFFIPRGMRLTSETYAGDLHAGIAIEDRPQLIGGSGWADGCDIDLQEHSRMLGRYGAVLTLLWHKWQ
jgi:Zn-dependent peptidase ImmA (M78 family)